MIQDKDMMKSMMIRYKQQVDARKFPYDKLVVSLRQTPSHEIINIVICFRGLTGALRSLRSLKYCHK